MNMYIMQTVSTRPRPWSSYTNVISKEVRNPAKMNNTEGVSKYNDHNSHYCSPVLARRLGRGTTYELPEKSPKKDKKWSIGNFFRRKKKESDSSSDEAENQNKGFLQKKKKKSDKRKRTNNAPGFDHVVVSNASRNTIPNGYKNYEDSDLSSRVEIKNFIPASDFTNNRISVPTKDTYEHSEHNRTSVKLSSPSVNSLGRRKKEIVKARAEARRDNSKDEESSDDDSQRSSFRSDENLSKQREMSLSRRSRAARTQRYLRRRSKDDELRDHLNDYSRNFKLPDERIQNVRSASKSPILSSTSKSKLSYANSAPSTRPNFSGLSTIPPSHNKFRATTLINGSSYKQPPSIQDRVDTGSNCALIDLNNQRSLSCDANIHSTEALPNTADEIVHVQLPIGKLFGKRSNVIVNQHVNPIKKQPPPPPPRDPRRILNVHNSDVRPISYSFEAGYNLKNVSDQQLFPLYPNSDRNSHINFHSNGRSTSEDHISWEPSYRTPLVQRPSSATPETNSLQKIGKQNLESDNTNGYRYLADSNPRSRKPISIQSCNNQQETTPPLNKSKKPFDFWRQKDEEIARFKKPTSESPMMFTAQTHVRTNIFLPGNVKDELDVSNFDDLDNLKREASPFRPITPTKRLSPTADKVQNGEDDLVQRKSSNLEDALDELEAIYNSLHLGDEDLLDRAEQREAAAAQKRKDAVFESFPSSIPRGAVSDSNFPYDANIDCSKKKRALKNLEPDRKADDMAFRKLNKERYNTISDPQSAVSKVSYLLTSPVFSTVVDEPLAHNARSKSKEPDITFDDVVYRNVKHTNNTLKVAEPQLPFGIPVGPVLPASNSDYLHATPEVVHQRFSYKIKKIPDVVKDDLAYRNLRKDANKEAALPPSNLSPEDYLNNNNNKLGETFKKKRAVRSLSANIFNLVHKDGKSNFSSINDDETKQNITDVADALEVARQILRDKENTINATRQAFMSDGELKYRKFGNACHTGNRKRSLGDVRSSSPTNNGSIYHHKLQVHIPIINNDRLETKPPTPDRRGSRASTKESTPIPSSPCEDESLKKQLQQSTLDELLTSLAVEARETSERITNELKILAEENERKNASHPKEGSIDDESYEAKVQHEDEDDDHDDSWSSHKQNKDAVINNKNINADRHLLSLEDDLKTFEQEPIISNLNLQEVETDSASEHAKLCEKLLQCVVENTELLAVTEEELGPSEEVARIKMDPLPEIVANVVLMPSDKSKLYVDPVSFEIYSESDHDYVNIQSADETEKDAETEDVGVDLPDMLTGLGSSTEMDDEEKELLLTNDDNFSADIRVTPIEKENDALSIGFQEFSTKDNVLNKGSDDRNIEGHEIIEQTDKGGGEECFCVEYIALPTKSSGFIQESRYHCNDLNRGKSETFINVYNFNYDGEYEDSSVDSHGSQRTDDIYCKVSDAKEELKCRTQFDLGGEVGDDNFRNLAHFNHSEDGFESLKSPKLVKNLDANYHNDSNNEKFDVGFSLDRDGDVGNDKLTRDSSELVADNFRKLESTRDKLSIKSESSKNLLGSRSRDFRHTLDEQESSASWYEDPAVIAIACSFGIACTSQLPSFDIMAALGLLYAIISLLVAFIART